MTVPVSQFHWTGHLLSKLTGVCSCMRVPTSSFAKRVICWMKPHSKTFALLTRSGYVVQDGV